MQFTSEPTQHLEHLSHMTHHMNNSSLEVETHDMRSVTMS